MTKNCGSCKHYGPIKGEPPAGYCLFVDSKVLPFWMDARVETLTILRRLPGSDVIPVDGADCDAFVSEVTSQ